MRDVRGGFQQPADPQSSSPEQSSNGRPSTHGEQRDLQTIPDQVSAEPIGLGLRLRMIVGGVMIAVGVFFFVANIVFYEAYYIRRALWMNELVALILVVAGLWVAKWFVAKK